MWKDVNDMRRIFALAAALALSAASATAAEQQMTVTLKDKSTLRGELVEFKDGVYRLKTEALGEVKIPADKVLSLKTADEPSEEPEQTGTKAHSRNTPPAAGKGKSRSPAIREGVPQGKAPPPQEGPAGPASDNLGEQQKTVNSQVQSMLMDGSFMDNVSGLGQNEAMQNVLQDSEIMEAIQRGDYDFLMNNEKMKNLIDSPDIQNILGGMSPQTEGE